jgi:tetratricopeptide (TPR) repeat protein
MKFGKFFSELKRRNVIKAVVAYLAVAWVILQLADTILPLYNAPAYVQKGLLFLLLIGLVFWTAFSWIYDLTPGGIHKTTEEEINTETQLQNSRRLNQVIVGSIITAVLLLVMASFWAGSQWSAPETAGREIRVAVIPLITEGSSETAEFYEEGMTESLIDALSELGQLTVLSLTSSKYLTAGFLPEDSFIKEEVENVDYFIHGTLGHNENRLTVELQLLTQLEKEPVWNKKYTEDLSRVRQLWKDIAVELTSVLGIGLSESQKLLKAGIKPVKPETYELYLKGKYYLNQPREEDWKRGLVYLLEAVDQNPADPYAYAGLAEGYISLGHSLMPPPDVFPKALAAAKRAIQLDSTNAEGWAALSHYHTYFGWDWELAEYAFKRANQLNPNMAYNHYHRAWYLALFDRMDEAIEEHKRAQEIDPFSSMHTSWLAGLYRMDGQYAKALEELDKAEQMVDDNALSMYVRAKTFLDMGREEEALQVMREAARINSGFKYFGLGEILFKTGHREEGMAIIKELESMERTPFFSLCLAQMYFSAGEIDKGFEWLRSAKGHAFYPWIRILVREEAARKDPRFLELIREMGLPPAKPLG